MAAAFPRSSSHYEAHGVILLADSGIAHDEGFVQSITFPPQWKKIGTIDGITDSCMVLSNGRLVRTNNPLCSLIPDDRLLLKMHSELVRLELGFKALIGRVLPSYGGADWFNCTFRFVKTENEPRHLDSFNNGRPFASKMKKPRAKFFFNVDAAPRIWTVGPNLPEILRASEGALGPRLPNDLNALAHLINSSGILDAMPAIRIEIPPRGIVFANGATVLHQVLYGERMVALEGFVPRNLLQSGSECEWDSLPGWITNAGYEVEQV